MKIGEVFVESKSEEEAQEFVEKLKTKLEYELLSLTNERESLVGSLDKLKARLYAKFGSTINLETDEEKIIK